MVKSVSSWSTYRRNRTKDVLFSKSNHTVGQMTRCKERTCTNAQSCTSPSDSNNSLLSRHLQSTNYYTFQDQFWYYLQIDNPKLKETHSLKETENKSWNQFFYPYFFWLQTYFSHSNVFFLVKENSNLGTNFRLKESPNNKVFN